MPGDPFQFLSPNTPIDSGVGPFNLAWHNEVTRTLHSTRGQRDADNTAKNGAALPDGNPEIWIRNDSGGDLDQFSVVGVGARVVAPSATDASHFGRAVFDSISPTTGDPFAILQWPTADTVMCPSVINGAAVCRVNMSSTTHEYADAGTGSYAALVSQSGVGPARILYADTTAATQLNGAINNSVTTITVDSTADFPDVPFVILIGTEQLNVTDTPSATTFTVTRGYNSTSAASHSDNDAVAFYSGEVWAVVNLDAQGSSTGLTEIIVYTNGTFVVPAVGSTVSVTVDTVSTAAWMVINGTVLVTDGTHIVQGTITAIASTTAFTLRTEYILGGSSGQTMADNAKVIISTAIRDAGATSRGVVSTGTQTFAGEKTFTSITYIDDASLHVRDLGTLNSGQFSCSATSAILTAVGAALANCTIKIVPVAIGGADDVGITLGGSSAPKYQIYTGGTLYKGATGTSGGGDTVKGGIITTLGSAITASSIGLGSVENTALSTWGGTANITAVGTLSTGTWQATAIDDAYISSASTWNTTSSNTSGTNSGDQTAATTPYTPLTSADWSGDPANVADALDRIAAAVAGLLAGSIP